MINKLLIGSVSYSVEYTDPVLSNNKDDLLWGEIATGQQLIKINSSLGPDVQRITLLHEIIHGMLLHYGLSNHKEEVPELLGYALDTFLMTNPEFVKMYIRSSQKDRDPREDSSR